MDEMREIPGYEGIYSITSDGKVWSHERVAAGKRQRIVGNCWLTHTFCTNAGYLAVHLSRNGGQKTELIHRLVASAWIPGGSAALDVNHKNGIKTDNRAENLEWLTRAENHRHAYATGLKVSAVRKLTDQQVIEIRSRLARGEYATDLGPEYGVGRKQIGKIKLGRTYRNVVEQ